MVKSDESEQWEQPKAHLGDDSSGNMHKYVKSMHVKSLSGWTWTTCFKKTKKNQFWRLSMRLNFCRDTTDVFAGLGHGGRGSLVWIQRSAAPVEIPTGHQCRGTPSCGCVLNTWIKISLLMKKQHACFINPLPACIKVKKQEKKSIIYSANGAAGRRGKVKNHMCVNGNTNPLIPIKKVFSLFFFHCCFSSDSEQIGTRPAPLEKWVSYDWPWNRTRQP